MNYDLYVDGDALAMILNQAFHRTFKYRAQLNTHFLCCFCQNLLVVEGYGADEVHLAVPVIVLHDVAFEERLEAVKH